jgi:hypothetical protein
MTQLSKNILFGKLNMLLAEAPKLIKIISTP